MFVQMLGYLAVFTSIEDGTAVMINLWHIVVDLPKAAEDFLQVLKAVYGS